ncbi:unnamed protein product [Prorocentrum cordatum]|uniref:Exocyst complex component Sec6 n=1 Tax=Prorocentrum cordatum TaxID=2364126 RepID=A0ABN9X0E6_9DINO|nr:unnamed protein product [Polarella glacialis]
MAESAADDLAALQAGSESEAMEQDPETTDGESSDFTGAGVQKCIGCGVKSKSNCPISEMRGNPKRVAWARMRKKLLMNKKTRTSRKRKVASGSWCRNCFNVWRTHMKVDVPNLENFENICKRDGKIKTKWVKTQKNYINLKGGGATRVRAPRKTIRKTRKCFSELVAPDVKFYTEAAYRKKYGDPKTSKAKPWTSRDYSGKEIHGYVVKEGEEGVYDLRLVGQEGIAMDEQTLNAEDNLHEQHGDDVMVQAQVSFEGKLPDNASSVVSAASSGHASFEAMSAGQLLENKRLAELKRQANKITAPEEPPSDSDNEKDSDGDDDTDSSSKTNDSENSDDEPEDAAAQKKYKRGKAGITTPVRDRNAKRSRTGCVTGFTGTLGSISGASASGASGRKEARKDSQQTRAQKPDELELDADGKAHAQDLKNKLESAVEEFTESKWSQFAPRQLSQHLKEVMVHQQAAAKWLKAAARKTLPSDLASMPSTSDTLQSIITFKKGWSKFANLDSSAALEQWKQLGSKLPNQVVPSYITKVMITKSLAEVEHENISNQLRIFDNSTEGADAIGVHMLPDEEQAGAIQHFALKAIVWTVRKELEWWAGSQGPVFGGAWVPGCGLGFMILPSGWGRFIAPKILGNNLDKVGAARKNINADAATNVFKDIVDVAAHASPTSKLPKTLIDDMAAIKLGFNLSPETASSAVVDAVHRLTQKKEQSAYLSLVKRKKVEAFESALRSLTTNLKTAKDLEGKQQAQKEFMKSLEGFEQRLPTASQDEILSALSKMKALTSTFTTMCNNADLQIDLESMQFKTVMARVFDKLAGSILAQVMGPGSDDLNNLSQKSAEWVCEAAQKLCDQASPVNDAVLLLEQHAGMILPCREVLRLTTLLKLPQFIKIVNADFLAEESSRNTVVTSACSKLTTAQLPQLVDIMVRIGADGAGVSYNKDVLSLIQVRGQGESGGGAEVDKKIDTPQPYTHLANIAKSLEGTLMSCLESHLRTNNVTDVSSLNNGGISKADAGRLALDATGSLKNVEGLKERVEDESVDKAMRRLDTEIGLNKAYERFCNTFGKDPEAGVEPATVSQEVPIKMQILPVIKSMFKLDKVLADASDKTEALFKHSPEFKSLAASCSNYFETPGGAPRAPEWPWNDVADHVLNVIKLYSEAKQTVMLEALKDIVAKATESSHTIPEHIVDYKVAIKHMDKEEIKKVVDFPGRPHLVKAVKETTMMISQWKEYTSKVSGILNVDDLEKELGSVTKLRDSARNMIVVRSALAVYLQADGKMVPNLYREMKLARATIPPKLRKELDKLAKESGVQEESPEDEDQPEAAGVAAEDAADDAA